MKYHFDQQSWIIDHRPELFFVAFGLMLIAVALKVLLSGRPIVFSSRWLAVLFLALFFRSPIDLYHHADLHTVLSSILWIPYFMMMWMLFRGVTVLGVSAPRFEQIWAEALECCHYSAEEKGGGVIIPQTGVQLSVTPPGILGMAFVKPRQRNALPTLRILAYGFKQSIVTGPRSIQLASMMHLLAAGVALIAAVLLAEM